MSERSLHSNLADTPADAGDGSTAWSREVSLLGSVLSGIKDQAQETIKHPQERLLEAAAGACLTTALSAVTHGEAGTLTHVIEGALAASFAKQAINGGSRLFTSAADAWSSPANLARDKQDVAAVAGSFVMDTAAFAAGGLGGRALSTRFVLPRIGQYSQFNIDAPSSLLDSKHGDFQSAADRLSAVKSSAGDMISTSKVLPGEAIFVPQKAAVVAPIGAALGTTDLGTCTALSVVDRIGGKQLLAHVDHLTDPDLLRQALSPLDLTRSRIYMLEGDGNQFSTKIGVYGSAERALTALGTDPNVLRNVRFIRYEGPYTLPNIAVRNGKLFSTAASYHYGLA